MTTVLVTYASKHGSTAEIAVAVAETLKSFGLQADCVAAANVESIDGYDAVVLGSAVYMRRWRREARQFLRDHAAELARLPFWVFSSGPVGDPAGDNAAWSEPPGTIRRVEDLGARDHAVIGGSLPKQPHGLQRSMVKNTPREYRDRRDWDEIRAWASGIAADLGAPAHA